MNYDKKKTDITNSYTYIYISYKTSHKYYRD